MPRDRRAGRAEGEAAIVVADHAHGRGIGRGLLERVLHDAAAAGITLVEAAILGDNHGAQHLFAATATRLGIPLRSRHETGLATLTLDLAPLVP